ncbi:L,D-peptidoglycan transpeptidase YkuD (ErfK/YbiS/YcfS/YnhG family) [Rhizobium skierniewicense]|uniref:L,D-peptidoglycan transpeptidase YkuD (ErfK/YbiS/YcfS/YnhG family) n=1 Tax=Rhizobium skierniewicense TaxID=984260 RepID=A0A7W6CFV9_9HYPH|nr:L,D-transpeptidase family protein [Rhizobium skierniewicense]MBB3946426.1 L,D-peptidoglycan transpeptidase YkuD (ErfK/YbiS/YcfS/YnhG family) [Rhizobium skierniewicense]
MIRRTEKQQKTSSKLLVRPAPGNKSRALLQLGQLTFPAAIGRNGRTIRKREGDGKTPIATMAFLYGFHRGNSTPTFSTSLKMHRIQSTMLWCDAPDHPNYNRLVKAPFKNSHEEMYRSDSLYDVCLVLDWNVTSRRRNLGSAIFMHMIRPGYEPTAGCIAFHPRDMQRILPFLHKGRKIMVL